MELPILRINRDLNDEQHQSEPHIVIIEVLQVKYRSDHDEELRRLTRPKISLNAMADLEEVKILKEHYKSLLKLLPIHGDCWDIGDLCLKRFLKKKLANEESQKYALKYPTADNYKVLPEKTTQLFKRWIGSLVSICAPIKSVQTRIALLQRCNKWWQIAGIKLVIIKNLLQSSLLRQWEIHNKIIKGFQTLQ